MKMTGDRGRGTGIWNCHTVLCLHGLLGCYCAEDDGRESS